MTIRAVAELAGVAPSTVSLVLNRPGSVAPETKQAVLHAIRKLNYVPSQPGRPRKRPNDPPASKRTNRIALLACGMSDAVMQSPVYMEVLYGVEERLREQRMTMVLRRVMDAEFSNASLLSTRVDGILLFGRFERGVFVERLKNIPCVRMMGLIKEDGGWDHVSYNNARVGQLAAEYLIERGHKHCAVIGETSLGCGPERQRTFQSVIASAGGTVQLLTSESFYIKTGTLQTIDRQALSSLVDRMLKASPRVTAAFVEADLITAALYPLLFERRVRPGTDVQVVSANNELLLLNSLFPRPATVNIHAENVGRCAVDQLLWRILHPNQPRVTLALEPEIVQGG